MKRVILAAAFAGCGPKQPKEPAPPPVDTARQQISDARAQLVSAEEMLQAGGAPSAYDAALRGIELLGKDYAPRRTKDDTGLHLHLAEELNAQGDRAGAAREAIGALRSRIEMYERRYR